LLDQAISVSDAFLEKGEIAKALDRRPASRSAIIPLGSGNGALRLTTARFGQRHCRPETRADPLATPTSASPRGIFH
jgi:hypothetical protein